MPDINNLARTAVIEGVRRIPSAGAMLGTLTSIFWPASGEDVWGQIRSRVEALVNQRISEEVYRNVSEDLQGLKNIIEDYTTAIKDSQDNPGYIRDKYIAALSHFLHDLPHFQAKGYELLLLPLFTQFATMHLTLLRDGYLYGKSWGFTPHAVEDEKKKLFKAIGNYRDYAYEVAQNGYLRLQLPGDTTYRIENWRTRNAYLRRIWLDVFDHSTNWVFLNPDFAKTQPVLVSERTIYADPIATADDTGITIASRFPEYDLPHLREPITGLNVWATGWLEAIQVKYGHSWHARQGSHNGRNTPPVGWSGSVDPKNPIVRVYGRAGDTPEGIQFYFKDGTYSSYCGSVGNPGDRAPGPEFDHHFDGHVLSAIYVMGVQRFHGCANCIILGFRLEGSYDRPPGW